ncbi:MAG: peptidase C1 [Methylophaga sp.]|nr:MAG: peptidase C1 [Methylophaga sp.]
MAQKTDKTNKGYSLSALQDIPDLRDWSFEPTLKTLKNSIRHPLKLEILDQKGEASCTGFSLAAIVNLLNTQRGNKTRVSPRMLYEMAKRHDEWSGEGYGGSSCRGAIKGWYNMGVCHDSKWKYVEGMSGFLTVDRAKDARKNTIGAYYRVQPRISDFHSALNEAGAIYCSANTHNGWQRPHKTTHIIPFEKEPQGGHAFAIVGYNSKGFWIQNSWSESWGKKGLAIWLYEDWHKNLMDAWVFNLALSTPQIWHLPVIGEKNRSGVAKKTTPPRSEIAGHFVHVDDGQFRTSGRYWSNADDVRTTAKNLAESKGKYKHLLLYAHGGLNSPKDSAKRIAAMKETFKKNGIYPYHFMYDTGIAEELKDVIFRRKKKAENRVGGFSDWTDRLLEWTTRIPGRALWREMKAGAASPFLLESAGTQSLKIFLDELSKKEGTNLKIHIAGHSTGAVLMAHLLNALEELAPELRVSSCSLLAPACTIDLFRSHYYPYLMTGENDFGVDNMQIFNLNEKLEKNDNVAAIYRKSLLYLVSKAFEENIPAQILGMKKYSDMLLEDNDFPEKLRINYSDGKVGNLTASTSHGGFDNDVATMNTLLKSILDAPPTTPFTQETLNY